MPTGDRQGCASETHESYLDLIKRYFRIVREASQNQVAVVLVAVVTLCPVVELIVAGMKVLHSLEREQNRLTSVM